MAILTTEYYLEGYAIVMGLICLLLCWNEELKKRVTGLDSKQIITDMLCDKSGNCTTPYTVQI